MALSKSPEYPIRAQMPEIPDLARAIRTALAQPRREPTSQDVVREANHALAVIEANMHAHALVPAPPRSERTFLVNQLLRASCDHGRSLMFLLSTNPMDAAGSALVLHRSQIEQFLRAVFFERDATDEELAYFLHHDELPKRTNADGTRTKLHVKDLARIAHRRMDMDADDKLASMVSSAWDPLNGMVHGGRSLLAVYRDHNDEVGCLVPPPILFPIIGNAMVLTNFALVVAVERANLEAQAQHEILVRPFEVLTSYQRARDQRMREVG